MRAGTLPVGQRVSAWIAVAFAVFLAVAEVARNWGNWGYWAFWVVDYIAVALLLTGGLRTLRSSRSSPSLWLSGGWGFACAMFYASFFSHLSALSTDPNAPDHGPIEHWRLTITIGVLFVITIVGFALSLIPDAPASSASPERMRSQHTGGAA